jgi:hypothetical protein
MKREHQALSHLRITRSVAALWRQASRAVRAQRHPPLSTVATVARSDTRFCTVANQRHLGARHSRELDAGRLRSQVRPNGLGRAGQVAVQEMVA